MSLCSAEIPSLSYSGVCVGGCQQLGNLILRIQPGTRVCLCRVLHFNSAHLSPATQDQLYWMQLVSGQLLLSDKGSAATGNRWKNCIKRRLGKFLGYLSKQSVPKTCLMQVFVGISFYRYVEQTKLQKQTSPPKNPFLVNDFGPLCGAAPPCSLCEAGLDLAITLQGSPKPAPRLCASGSCCCSSHSDAAWAEVTEETPRE